MSDTKTTEQQPWNQGLVEAPPVIPGTLRDREQRAKELNEKPHKNRLLTPRRALMAAGAGILAVVLAKGAAVVNKPSTESSGPITQSETYEFNPDFARDKILKADPDAKVNLGGQLDITFTQGSRNEVFPRVRTSPRVIHPRDSEFLNIVFPQDIKAINGETVDPKPGLELEIDNYTTVTGEDADNGLTPGAEGLWAALVLTKADGSETLGYISLSNQTAPNWHIESGGHTVELKTQEKLPKNFNKVTVVNSSQ